MKKTFFMAALISMIFMTSIPVYAQSIYETTLEMERGFEVDDSFVALLQANPQQIYEKYANIMDIQEVSLDEEKVSEFVVAHEYDEDGTVRDLECDVTLNKVVYQNRSSSLYSVNTSTATLYVLSATATTKKTEKEETKDGVTLYGCIGWTDNFGPWNKFEYCKGSRKGSYDASEQGTYLVQRQYHQLCNGFYDESFYDTSDDPDPSGYQFQMRVTSKTASGKSVDILFSTGILD